MEEKYIRYCFNNDVYYLVFSGSRVYSTRSLDAGAPRQIVSRDYLDQDWICRNGEWTVVPRAIPTRIPMLLDLAMDFLPYWNDVVWYECNRSVRKQWSHYGATQRYGDVSNKVYTVLIDLLLRLRRHRNQPYLNNVCGLGTEKKGDVIEGIMGVRYLGLGDETLDMYASHADELSCWVYETWNANPHIWSSYDMANILWNSDDLDWLRQKETLSLQLHTQSQRLHRRMIKHVLKQKLPQTLIDCVIQDFVGWRS